MVKDGIERVSLSKFIQENFNWDSLLPELHISNKFISFSIVNKPEIVSIFLFDHELGLSFFTSMSSNFNKFVWESDMKRDIELFERFLKSFLIGKLGHNTGEVGHSDRVSLGSSSSIRFKHWVCDEEGRLNLGLVFGQG